MICTHKRSIEKQGENTSADKDVPMRRNHSRKAMGLQDVRRSKNTQVPRKAWKGKCWEETDAFQQVSPGKRKGKYVGQFVTINDN